MATFENVTFKDIKQELDGIEFIGCRFENVQLIYKGGLPPTFKNCNFFSSPFIFEGCAENTVTFLRDMADPKSGLQIVVRETFPSLFAQG